MRISSTATMTILTGVVLAGTAMAQPIRLRPTEIRKATGPDPSLQWERVVSVAGQFEGADEMVVDSQGYAVVLGYLAIEQDFYAMRFDPRGTLLWTRIIGGSGLDNAGSVAVDDAGDVYIVGRTLSADFPTLNAYQNSLHGPSDAFLMKLSAGDGSTVFSTYFGGSRAEWGFDVEIGMDGSVHVVGQTDSIDLDTADPIQGNLTLTQCFCDDAFVTQFSPQADAVIFSTYLGGAFDDQASEIELDAAGNIYIAGRTRSDDFPTLNPNQPIYGGGEFDCFAAAISPSHQLSYSTFLGGEDWDLMMGMDVDDDGNVTLTGSTQSTTFPTTPAAYQPVFVGGINACEVPFGGRHNCYDMFVTRLGPDGGYIYSTFIGGHQVDEARNVSVDARGRAHIVGYTYSNDFPLGVPISSVVALRLTADGSNLDFALTHDTPSANAGSAIAVHGGSVYIAAASGTINGNQVTYDTYVARYGGAFRDAAPTGR